MNRLVTSIAYLASSRIGQLGVALATAAGLTIATFFTTEFFGVRLGPYSGLIGFVGLPLVFVIGLALIAAGAMRLGTTSVSRDVVRQTLGFVGVMTAVNLIILLSASYRAVHQMDSQQFCGQTCHVMAPQYAAYQGSIHSKIQCVECHVTPGPAGMVNAKLAGTRQLILLTTGGYARPIHGDAKESCMSCHNPPLAGAQKIVGKAHFADDEKNTASTTWLSVKTGAIHKAHAASACALCHNRAGHDFPTAEGAIEAALLDGRLDRNSPFIKKRALAALTSGAPLTEPAAANTVAAIKAAYVFPLMSVDWGTYPNHLGHQDSPGCFRCHDGSKAKNECDTCHTFVEVKNP